MTDYRDLSATMCRKANSGRYPVTTIAELEKRVAANVNDQGAIGALRCRMAQGGSDGNEAREALRRLGLT